MASRSLQRGASVAAAALAAGVQASNSDAASCDFAPEASQGPPRFVMLESSWEDLLQKEDLRSVGTSANGRSASASCETLQISKPPPPPVETQPNTLAGAPDSLAVVGKSHLGSASVRAGAAYVDASADSNAEDVADNMWFPPQGTALRRRPVASAGQGGSGQQLVSISLAPPTPAEAEAALKDIESMLNASMHSSQGSWSHTSDYMEASENAILRAKSLCASDPDLTAESALAANQSATVRLGSSMTATSRISASAASGSAVQARAAAAYPFGAQAAIKDIVAHHPEQLRSLMADPSVWGAIMQSEHAQSILRGEAAGARFSGVESEGAEGEGGAKGDAADGGSGKWLQDLFEFMHSSLSSLFATLGSWFTSKQEADSAQAGNEAGKSPNFVMQALSMVVVIVAIVVLAKRAR